VLGANSSTGRRSGRNGGQVRSAHGGLRLQQSRREHQQLGGAGVFLREQEAR